MEVDGELTVGVASAPALRRRWYAARGEGAYANGERIAVSRVTELADAKLSHSSIENWKAHDRLPQFLDLVGAVGSSRGFGDFWQHMLVAQVSVDIALEPEANLWDLAALKAIVEEAGGMPPDLAGGLTPP